MIYVILLGPSLSNLKKYKLPIKTDDLLVGVNNFWTVEDILRYQKKRFDYIFSCANPWDYQDEIKKELLRGTKFIVSNKVYEITGVFRPKKFKNCIVIDNIASGETKLSDRGYNSLTAILLYFIKYGNRDFTLFGADGNGVEHYNDIDGPENDIDLDTRVMNEYFWDEVRNIGVFPGDISIINVNDNSSLKCFRSVSYKDYFG